MTESDNSPSYASAIVTDEESSGNPAWGEVLGAVPEEYHQALTPHLQKWDQGVNQKFQDIHKEYEQWKPYKEQGLDKQTVDFALGVMSQLENDPMEIYKALHSYLGEQGLLEALGQEDDDDEEDAGLPDDPRFSELQEGFSTLAEAWLSQEQAKQEAEEDAKLEVELKQMTQKYGDFDEEFVLSKMVNGMDTEDAVKSYFAYVDKILHERNRPNPPRVIGSAGAFPGQGSIDPKKLTDRGRKDLVADMLKQYL